MVATPHASRLSPLALAFCALLVVSPLGCSSSPADPPGQGAIAQPLVDLSTAERAIHAVWRRHNECENASACVGSPYEPTSSVQLVPGTGADAAFRRYEQAAGNPSVGVYSGAFGAVIMPSWRYDAWLALAGQTAETGEDLFTYIGMPRQDGTFERGIVTETGIAVTGHVYSGYLAHADKLGAPTSPELGTVSAQRFQTFEGGEVHWKSGVGTFALLNGPVLDEWKAQGGASGPLGFPVTELIVYENLAPAGSASPQVGRFEQGAIYFYPGAGTHSVTGKFLDKFEQEHGGVTGFLGFPIGVGSIVAPTDANPSNTETFIDFQNGIMVERGTNLFTFSSFDFFLERLQARDSDCLGCGQADMRVDVTVTTANGVEVDTRVYKEDHSDPEYNRSWAVRGGAPFSQWFADVSVHVVEVDDWPEPDDLWGTVTEHYSIDNLWGFDEDSSPQHENGKFRAWFTLRNNISYGDKPFRQEQWWRFNNFSTPELTYDQYAQTFVDVSADDAWWSDPLNVLLYELVYKEMASSGNCFGMTVESVYSTLGISPYPQPIAQHLPDVPQGADLVGSTEAHLAMINQMNVKMGYQLGSSFVAYTLGAILSGLTHDPGANYDLSLAAHLTGNYPLISISDYFGNRGHSVRPYDWRTDSKGAGVFTNYLTIADPNWNWRDSDPASQTDDVIVIERYVPTSSYFYANRNAQSGPYEGGFLSGGRLFVQPLSLYSVQPYTPFGVIGQAVDGLSSLVVGSEAKVWQLADSEGRKLFVEGLTGPPSEWGHLVQDGATRVPGVAPIPLSDGGGADLRAQLFVSRSDGATHAVSIGPDLGVADGTRYDAVFTSAKLATAWEIPGTAGKPETLTTHQINGRDAAVSLKLHPGAQEKRIRLIVSGADKSRWAEYTDMKLVGGQTIRVNVTNGGFAVETENDGPPTTATLRFKHGRESAPQDVGIVNIPSGHSSGEFQLPNTTLSLTNDTYGKNGWLIEVPTLTLQAVSYASKLIRGIDWSNDNQQTWHSIEDNPASFVYGTEGESVVWYTATDQFFNAELPKSYAFKIDTRVPMLEASAGPGTFTRVDTFTAGVTATDPQPGSGIARVVATVDGVDAEVGGVFDLFWMPLGGHILEANAEDYAGWSSSSTATFQVVAELDDLPATIRELRRRGELTSDGVTNSLVKKAENALSASRRGSTTAARQLLGALTNEVRAQEGKMLSRRGAALLEGDIRYVSSRI